MNTPARLRVITGECIMANIATSRVSPARAAHRVVQAAQAFAAAVLDTGVLETIDLTTEAGKVLLAFLDSVDEYEYRSAAFPQDPATLF